MAAAPAPRVYLMENRYPCLPSAGLKLSHEAPAGAEGWKPGREAACSLALSRDEYEAAAASAAQTGEAAPHRENFEVCICRDPLPLLPPRCPLDAPTCGNYPNDPSKMPAVKAAIATEGLGTFCRAFGDTSASDIYDDRLAKLICAPYIAASLDRVPPGGGGGAQ
jgi:hypothetical protein